MGTGMRAFVVAILMSATLSPKVQAESDAAPKVVEVTASSGVSAYLLEEPSIPFFVMRFHFEGGAVFDPPDKAGLARMVAALIDEGAGDYDSQAFRTALEDNAIELSFDAGRDSFSGTLKTLTENSDLAIELLRLALSEARFDDEPVDRIRAQITAGLKRRLNDPNDIAGRTYFAKAFPDHAYGRPSEGQIETIANVTKDDLRSFVGKQFAKDKLIVGVAGDIDEAGLQAALDKAFGELPDTSDPLPVETTKPEAIDLMVVEQAVPQSVVTFGHEGIERDHEDYYAAYVANHILGGGGFSARLMQEIREKRGLAYGAYSYLLQADYAPLFLGRLATSNKDVATSIQLVRQEVAKMAEGQITEQDLADAKTYLTGSFPLRLTSNAQIAGLLVGMQIAELGTGYIEERNGFIEAVDLDQVKRVAKDLFKPEALSFVVVGQPQGLDG